LYGLPTPVTATITAKPGGNCRIRSYQELKSLDKVTVKQVFEYDVATQAGATYHLKF
jgi:pyridoxal biosynthesis lyase PdxS